VCAPWFVCDTCVVVVVVIIIIVVVVVESCDSLVSIVLSYRLDDWGYWV
jgi:hypothetical protein